MSFVHERPTLTSIDFWFRLSESESISNSVNYNFDVISATHDMVITKLAVSRSSACARACACL